MNVLAEQCCRRKAIHSSTYDPCLTFANPAVTIAKLRCGQEGAAQSHHPKSVPRVE